MGFYNPIYKNELFFSSKTHISTPFAQDIYGLLFTNININDVIGGRNILINSFILRVLFMRSDKKIETKLRKTEKTLKNKITAMKANSVKMRYQI